MKRETVVIKEATPAAHGLRVRGDEDRIYIYAEAFNVPDGLPSLPTRRAVYLTFRETLELMSELMDRIPQSRVPGDKVRQDRVSNAAEALSHAIKDSLGYVDLATARDAVMAGVGYDAMKYSDAGPRTKALVDMVLESRKSKP